MKISIYGTGGIGGYLAGKLGPLLDRPDSGLSSLSLIARGPHLSAIRERGLRFIDAEGESLQVHPTAVSDDPADLPSADVVFLCVKGYDLDSSVDAIAPCIDEETLVIPLLNGADIYERVRDRLDTGIVLPGAIYISSAITEAGTVQHKGGKGMIILGKGHGRDAVKPEPLLRVFDGADIPYQWHEDPFPAIWSKFLFISPFSLAGAATGKSLGELLDDPKTSTDIRSMVEEVAAVARAKGISLPEDAVESTMNTGRAFPPETKTSFQRDVEARKERDEREVFGAAVLKLATELGVKTPVLARYFESLAS